MISGVFTITTAILLPVGAAVWMATRRKGYCEPILLGVATFTVFQMLTRIPILRLILPPMPWFAIMNTVRPVLSALFYGVTAALFEEGGRYIVINLFLKDRRRVSDGIAFGIGHGGIEAILLVGIYAILTLFSPEGVRDPGGMFATGAERVSAMIFHIAWSVMVLKSVRKRNGWWLALAFGLHALVDIFAVLAYQRGMSRLGAEAALGTLALLLLGYIIYEYKQKENEDEKQTDTGGIGRGDREHAGRLRPRETGGQL